MATLVSNSRPKHNCLRASRPRPLPLHGHRQTAPKTNTGTSFQIESSYASRNNRNRISYEKSFFSYDHVPMLRYGSTIRNPAGPASSRPNLSRPAINRPRSPLPAFLQSEQSPKLFQSCNRNSSDSLFAPPVLNPSQPDTNPGESPVPLSYKLKHSPKLFQSCNRNNLGPNASQRASSHLSTRNTHLDTTFGRR